MKPRSNFSTLFCLILVSIIFAEGEVVPSHTRQGNNITFTCVSFNQGEIRIQVVSVSADGSNRAAVLVEGPTTAFSAMVTFSVTPSDEKAAYCEVGDNFMSTDLVYFGGEY